VSISIIKLSGRPAVVGGLLLAACGALTGCQIDVAGQTLPSPYHLTDDVQYYAPGPEFKLANEATALAQRRAEEISTPQAEGLARPAVPAPPVPAPPGAGPVGPPAVPPGAVVPAAPGAAPPPAAGRPAPARPR
jgi:hypothetical protein